MNSIVIKPYKPILYSILLFIGFSIIGIDSTIDIQLHDTYFVIASFHFGIVFSIFSGLIGLIYWSTRKIRLVNWMTAFHVVTTILAFVLIIITSLIFKRVIEMNYNPFLILNQIIFLLILVAILSQIIFMVNLVYSLIKNNKYE